MPHILRPQGAFGVRQLAAAFKNAQNPVFQFFIESGSEQPHISESFALQKSMRH